MTKISNLVSESIKDRLVGVTSKPKRRKLCAELAASTDDRKRQILGEIKSLDKAAIERGEMREELVPVLFLWGAPRQVLSSKDVSSYKELGGNIKYLTKTEVKSLNIK